MAAFLDVCRFLPTLGGLTDWTFSAAVTGYQSPAAAGVVNGTLYKYRAESADLTQWEIGEGAYNTGTGVLARTTVLFNNLGTTAKINFSAVPQVAVVAIKEDLPNLTTPNAFTDATASTTTATGAMTVAGGVGVGGQLTASNLAATAAPAAAASLDCSASTVTIANGANAVVSFNSGLFVITEETSTGHTGAYLTGSATTVFLGGGAIWVASTTTPAAGKVSLAYDGAGALRIYNNVGVAATFGVALIKTRTGI